MSCLFGLIGGLIGVMISLNNGDELGWSLLRGAMLMLIFGTVSRWWLEAMATAWLESRIESFQTVPVVAPSRIADGRPASRLSH